LLLDKILIILYCFIDQENLIGQQMEDTESLYVIENLEQLRALADPLRTRILEALARQPKTTSQLAEMFGETNNKLHYHVHELERFGLIKLVEKRERGGVLEKYYRAVARDFTIAPALLSPSTSNDVIEVVRSYFDQMVQGLTQTLERSNNTEKPSESVHLDSEAIWMTEDEYRELIRQFGALIAPFLEPRSEKGERAWRTYFVLHTSPHDEEGPKTTSAE
jgi:DNA-binding transcriptional ArsR family regulator